jgi:hypothetical protein
VITTGSMRLASRTGDVRGKMQHPTRTKGIEPSSDPARSHLRAVQEHLGNADIQPDDDLQTAREAGSPTQRWRRFFRQRIGLR